MGADPVGFTYPEETTIDSIRLLVEDFYSLKPIFNELTLKIQVNL